MVNEGLKRMDAIVERPSERQGGLTLTPTTPKAGIRKPNHQKWVAEDSWICEECLEERFTEHPPDYKDDIYYTVRYCACEREAIRIQDEAREERRRVALAQKIEEAIPKAYCGIALDNRLQEFVDSFTGEQWLLLRGRAGVGKTTQAWNVAKALAATGKVPDAYFNQQFAGWNVPMYLATLRAGYGGDVDTPDLMRPWLVLLDDVGSERIKRDSDGDSWAREQLFLVINHRWEQQKPTIITTNLNAKEIEEHLDERIADRIFDKRLTTVVTLTGESWRRRG